MKKRSKPKENETLIENTETKKQKSEDIGWGSSNDDESSHIFQDAYFIENKSLKNVEI